jgi:hypothetical protein
MKASMSDKIIFNPVKILHVLSSLSLNIIPRQIKSAKTKFFISDFKLCFDILFLAFD